MIQEGLKYLAAGMNPMSLKRGIDTAIARVVQELKQIAQPCVTPQEIAHVAAISANNDPSIGELIFRAMDKVGREGAISIEDSSGIVNELEIVEGLQFDRGYLSPYFVNYTERGAAVLEEPLRRIVLNAAEEPSIAVHRVEQSSGHAFGYNAASGEYGDLLLMGVIDPAKVTRLALQNAGSIASLILTTDCMIAAAPKTRATLDTTPPEGNFP
jgi:chaperonin GroEL (HSP60 family)